MTRNSLARALSQLSRYVRQYGALGSYLLFSHVARLHLAKRSALVRVRLPGLSRYVSLRAGTSDWQVFTQVFLDEEYGIQRMSFFNDIKARYERILEAGRTPVVVDAGANIGLSTVFLHQLFPLAHFVLIEPDEENAKVAALNTRGIKTSLLRVGLWSHRTRIKVVNPEAEGWGYQFEETTDGTQGVETVTIDDAVGGVADGELFLVKMDIEGAERQVLGARGRWLKSFVPVIVEPHDRFTGPGSVSGLLEHPDYRNGTLEIKGENLIFVPRQA